jgi:hypothetical protein
MVINKGRPVVQYIDGSTNKNPKKIAELSDTL